MLQVINIEREVLANLYRLIELKNAIKTWHTDSKRLKIGDQNKTINLKCQN